MSYLTIITPTYNRANFLIKCYDSLSKQTYCDFQWLIIDDGSTDNTKDILKQILSKNTKFEINYYYKENGGKHSALNFSHKYIKSDVVLILDSDDYLTTDAISTIVYYWNKYKDDKKICGLSFLRGYDLDSPMTKKYPEDNCRSNYIKLRINKKIFGDCSEIIRTSVMKEFPFPIFYGEKFISESYLWINLSYKYDMIYINKIIYISRYLDGGLTKLGKQLRIANPIGGICISELSLSKDFSFLYRVKKMLLYICYSFFAKKKIVYILKSSKYKLLCFFSFPFGYLLYIYWYYKYSK